MNQSAPTASVLSNSSLPIIRKSRAEHGLWIAIVLSAAGMAALYAYYSIFSLFQAYDDEGYILISLQSFFHGKALYDEVYSSFQPAFYVLHWLLFKLLGTPLCHDSIRLLTVFFWVAAAGLNGLITFRLTSNRLLSLLVSLVSVRCLGPFANEPGHPQALAYVLVAGVAALFSFADAIRPRLFALAIGCLTALVLLTKINVGLFLILPVALIACGRLNCGIGVWLKAAVGALMIGLPVLVWRTQLAAKGTPIGVLWLMVLLALVLIGAQMMTRRIFDWVAAVAFIVCAVALFGMNSVSVAALPVFSAVLLVLSICIGVLMWITEPTDPNAKSACWAWALYGWVFSLATVTLVVMARGTTLQGLADGLIWWPAKVSTSFLIRLRSNWLGAFLGVAGAACCYGYLRLRGKWAHRSAFRSAIITAQLGFGLAVLVEFYLLVPGSRTLMPLHNDLPHFWMLPFAWLVAVPETGTERTRFARLALLSIAVTQPLIACPIAGTQLVPASMLICVIGAVCLANGLSARVGSAAKWAPSKWLRFALGSVGAAVLLVPFGVDTLKLHQRYTALTPLNLRGAMRIRLPEQEVQIYHQIVDELARPEVGTFLTLPGLDSFYLWVQKDPPNDLNVSAWIVLLDGQAQERIWQACAAHRGLMVVRNRQLIRSWVGGRSVAQLPLVRHIDQEFRTVSTFGSYELMVRR